MWAFQHNSLFGELSIDLHICFDCSKEALNYKPIVNIKKKYELPNLHSTSVYRLHADIFLGLH
jgi:hypothetical protein